MRLLLCDANGDFTLSAYNVKGARPQSYAIVSHTWLDADEEITFDDLQQRPVHGKPQSLQKIRICCQQAVRDGVSRLRMDTCCIDKKIPSELSEAITSMFDWYRNATRCYVYLSDVSADPDDAICAWQDQFRRSRWFTRGWTLQELLAPRNVEFLSREGIKLGDKRSLCEVIKQITNIQTTALLGELLTNFTIAERMVWAKHRKTTREEDQVYSLLGIFGVFLPPLYGEGANAYKRLQHALKRLAEDVGDFDGLINTLPECTSAAFDSRENQHEAFCLRGTRIEMLEEITLWASATSASQIYWLTGMAGTGKSTLARTVATHQHQRGTLAGTYFFCRGQGEASKADSLITSLAVQLSRNLPSTMRHICEAIRNNKNIAQASMRVQWEELIVVPLEKLSTVERPFTALLIIDALDECDDPRDIECLFRLLSMTERLKKARLRVLITSRPDGHIKTSFATLPKSEQSAFALHDAQSVNEDLRTYFEGKLHPVAEANQLRPWPERKVITRLVETAHGLFLWAATACRYICNSTNPIVVKSRTRQLTDGHVTKDVQDQLDNLYLTVLQSSVQYDDGDGDSDGEQMYATWRIVVGSVVLLRSRLSIHALSNLLGVRTSVLKAILVNLETILNVPKDDSTPIHLHHPSFRDFILSKVRCKNERFWIDESKLQGLLGERCIRLMTKYLKSDIWTGVVESARQETHSIDASPVFLELRYACVNWSEHHRASDVVLADNDHAHKFLSRFLLRWVATMSFWNLTSHVAAILRMHQSLLRYWAELHRDLGRVRIVHADRPEPKDEYNYVNDLVFTPDGSRIAIGTLDDSVRVWNLLDLQEDVQLQCQDDKISAVAISPHGDFLLAGSDDATVAIWDLETRTATKLTGHSRWINTVAISPDGDLIATASMDETIRFYKVAGAELSHVAHPKMSGINSIDFSPDGRYLAIGAVETTIRMYDVGKHKVGTALNGHGGPVNSVRFASRGNLLASGSDDRSVRLWNWSAGVETLVIDAHDRKILCVVFDKTVQLVASGSDDKTVKVWNCSDGQLMYTLDDHVSGICAVAFSPDNLIIAAAAFNDEVRLWRVDDGTFITKLPDYEPASGQWEENVGELAHSDSVTCLRRSSDGEIVVSGSLDGNVMLWSKVGKRIHTLMGHTAAINDIVICKDLSFIASASTDGSIIMWNPDSDRPQRTLCGHSGSVRTLKLSRDGARLASCSSDKTINLWHPASGKLVNTLRGHTDSVNAVAFSSDGTLLASCSVDGGICLWSTTAKRARWSAARSHERSMTSVVFSQDDGRIAVSSLDGTCSVWSIDGGLHWKSSEHDAEVWAVAFSSDKQHVLSTFGEYLNVWHFASGELLSTIKLDCQVRGISPTEDHERFDTDRGSIRVELFNMKPSVDEEEVDQPVLIQKLTAMTVSGAHPDLNDEQQRTRKQDGTVFVDENWVWRNGKNVLWLPNAYRADCVISSGRDLVLGHANGALSFLDFADVEKSRVVGKKEEFKIWPLTLTG